MRKLTTALGLGALIVLVTGPMALAKGQTDRIVIIGPEGKEPIEITDRWVLDQFNAWGGEFLGDVVEAAPASLAKTAAYEVHLELRHPDLQVFYAFYYYPGTDGEPGYIRLPGQGEEWYATNVSTIIRGSEGGWHLASTAWEAVAASHLGSDKVPQAPKAPPPVPEWVWYGVDAKEAARPPVSGAPENTGLILGAIVLAGAATATAMGLRRRRRAVTGQV